MKSELLALLPKAPMQYRIGPKHEQDWYQSCVVTADRLKASSSTKAFVPTAFELFGKKEGQIYRGTFHELGVPDGRVHYLEEGVETIRQLELSQEEAERRHKALVIVMVRCHARRVRMLCRAIGIKAEFLVADGIPSPRDVLMERLLLPIYPLFQSSRFRSWFRRRVEARRFFGDKY